MGKWCAGLAAALMLCAGDAAADGPRSWTGFYVGAGIGAGAVVQKQTFVDSFGPLFSDTVGGQGLFASVTLGYDLFLVPRVLAGAFLDYDLSAISSDGSGLVTVPFDHRHSWSLGGRIGYLASPKTLWYGTGGFTQASFDFDFIGSRELRGFFAGVGVETHLVGNWFVRGEYRYTQFLAETVDFCGCASLEADTSIHTGKIVLVYRFGSGVTP